MLKAMKDAIRKAGDTVAVREKSIGDSEWLVLFGVGAPDRAIARRRQVKDGRLCLMFDMGYFGREKLTGHLRASLNDDHPQAWLDKTPQVPDRWAAHRIELREDADPDGPIILVGLGRKSRTYLRAESWEREKLKELRHRFPGRRVIFRPKPGHVEIDVNCEYERKMTIEQLLCGASLVVCRHSNVAVDAVIAGVPFEAVDGAAMWLIDKPYTRDNRLDFLRRLSFWQWKTSEAFEAWKFFKGVAA